jgi:hypothetical protein
MTNNYANNASEQASDTHITQPATGLSGEPVGHVVVLDDLIITYSGEDSSIKAYLNREARSDIKTGSYVQIPYPADDPTEPELTDELFASVEAVQYLNDSEINELTQTMNVDVTSESNERRYNQVVHLNPIAILKKDRNDDGEIVPIGRKNVDAVPKPFTHLYPSDDETYLRTGLNIPEDGLALGFLAKNGEAVPKEKPLVYKIRNPGTGESGESTIFRHTLLTGSTGKGKTFFTKNTLRQLMDGTKYDVDGRDGQPLNPQLPAFVIIDPENEYSEMREDSNFDQSRIKELARKGIKANGIDSDPDFDLKTFVPNVRNATSPGGLNTHREFSIPFEMVNDYSNKLAMPFETGEPTRAAMSNTLSSFFNHSTHLKGGQWYDYAETTYDEFITWLDSFNTVEFTENQLALENNMTDGMWGAMLRRFKRGEFYRVFDSGADPITDIINDFIRPGQVTVVPTAHLDPAAEKLVVMSLMSLIVENKIGSGTNKRIYETPLILGVDEAHNFLSDTERVQDTYIVNKFLQVAKQGRKYKLGMFLITQNPEDINDGILKQTNTKIYLGLEPEVLSRIPVPDGFQNKIPNYGKGQAVVKAPDVEATEIQGFNVCLVKHSK